MVEFDLLREIYQNKRVLVTGSTGFKGSWLCLVLKQLGADVYGYSLAAKTDQDNFIRTGLEDHIHQEYGDIRDFDHFRSYIESIQPDFVFHLAAQAIVIEGYNNPRETFEVNMMGTVNLLEIVRNTPRVKFVINITSDKSYKNKEWHWSYREDDQLGGEDPYSASKSCAELIGFSYLKSYYHGLECGLANARAGNVIGGGDWALNRIVPDIFRAIETESQIVLRNPHATRPWQHVLEPIAGYLQLGLKLLEDRDLYSGAWNFGPREVGAVTVKALVDKVLQKMELNDYPLIVEDGFFKESTYLKLDISRAIKLLDWNPILDLDQTLTYTVDGYVADGKQGNLFQARMRQIEAYFAK